MSLLARVRLLLARRPWIYWSCVGACVIAVWLSLSAAHSRAAAAQAGWGTTRTVWVADDPVVAGEAVVASAREYPVAMVPADAVDSLPSEAVATRSIGSGEVLVAADLAGTSIVPAGWVVFAVPSDAAPTLVASDRVAVFASGRRWCDGLVVAASVDSHELAVAGDCAAEVSAQLAIGAVTLARLS